MTLVAYARVSSTDQDLSIQREQLLAAGAERIFEEKRSGTTTDGRDELKACIEWCRNGDVLMVTRLDRLARSTMDMLATLKTLEARGVALRCLHQPIDTSTPHGRMFITMLAAFAEFETAVRRERQAEGIARAKTLRKYHGAKPTYDAAKLRELRLSGLSAAEIAKATGASRKTIYRLTPGLWEATPIPPKVQPISPTPPSALRSPETVPPETRRFKLPWGLNR